MENGVEEEGGEEEVLDDEVDASRLERFMRDRRRARSLPACLLGDVPGANGRKKSVKFADSMGQSLARVKHFSTLEEPQIPSKVLSRHRSFPPQQHEILGDLVHGYKPAPGPGPARLVACFPEPRDVERRVRRLRVCLERVAITQFDVRGQIRVLGDDQTKEVGIRYTFNDWLSHVDVLAVPAAGDARRLGERFVFTVFTPPFVDPGSSVHFAVFLKDDQGEFWDNNEGGNYSLRYGGPASGDAPFVSAAFHAT